MRRVKSQKYISYFTYEVFVSDAYGSLRASSKEILLLLYFELEYSPQHKRSQKYTPRIVNRNDIKLPYKDIERVRGYSKGTIWKALKELLEKGFIKIIRAGGGAKGDTSVYGITEDWRTWKPGQVVRELKIKGQIGWQKKKAS